MYIHIHTLHVYKYITCIYVYVFSVCVCFFVYTCNIYEYVQYYSVSMYRYMCNHICATYALLLWNHTWFCWPRPAAFGCEASWCSCTPSASWQCKAISQFFGVLPFPYVFVSHRYRLHWGIKSTDSHTKGPKSSRTETQCLCMLNPSLWDVTHCFTVTCSFGDQVWARKAKWKHIQKYPGHRQGSKTNLTSLTSLTSGYIWIHLDTSNTSLRDDPFGMIPSGWTDFAPKTSSVRHVKKSQLPCAPKRQLSTMIFAPCATPQHAWTGNQACHWGLDSRSFQVHDKSKGLNFAIQEGKGFALKTVGAAVPHHDILAFSPNHSKHGSSF